MKTIKSILSKTVAVLFIIAVCTAIQMAFSIVGAPIVGTIVSGFIGLGIMRGLAS